MPKTKRKRKPRAKARAKRPKRAEAQTRPKRTGQRLPPLLPEPDAEMWDHAVELPDETALDQLARDTFANLLMMCGLVPERDAEVLGRMAGALDALPSLIEARGMVRGYDAAVAALSGKAARSRQETELPMRRRLGLLLSLHVPELPRGYAVVEAEPCLNLPDEDGLTQPLSIVTVGIEVPGRDGVLRVTAANMVGLRAAIAEALDPPSP